MSHRITDWDPEDVVAWQAGNRNIARRNLIWSVAAEHIGFSVWSIWSVMVLFMPESVYGFSAGDKFLLGIPALKELSHVARVSRVRPDFDESYPLPQNRTLCPSGRPGIHVDSNCLSSSLAAHAPPWNGGVR